MLEQRLQRVPSALGACADDVGLVSQDVYRALALALPVFDCAAQAAGLELNVTKSIIVPLAALPEHEYRNLLDVAGLPPSFKVQHMAKYLGIFLGRGGSVRSWGAPARKCLGQAVDTKSLGLGLVKSIALFNQNGFSCLAYVSQFFSLPQSVYEAVRAAGQAL
eukprot:5830980-Pyramimonas_sp.AAC.1